ncbi:MAG: acetate kinase [Bacilli bacterium]|nr:acetate kinase [Bacilli bacterium]
MKIISINAGSSSLKFQLFDMDSEKVLASGLFERIGIEGSLYTIKYNSEKIREEIELANHTDAVNILLEKLIALDIIASLDEIDGVGHRIVQGGDKYNKSVIITDEVISDIEAFKDLAPLHNPAGLLGIQAVREVLPDVPMVAVFDTAFHQTMKKERYLYPIPYAWYRDYKIRKYGFHGTSHRFIASKAKEILGRENIKVISCHLGSGGSICAIENGASIDTTMGFTPLAGIMMGTRSGDIDPSIIPYIMEKEGKNASEIIDDLNKVSGLLGVSETSSDFRDISKGISEGNSQCLLAQEIFIRRVVAYIAEYYVLLNGADMIVFTAGIGENSLDVRGKIVERLSCLGIKLDESANDSRGEIKKISTDDSSVLVYAIPTDEELMIARDTLELVQNG